MPSTTRRKPPAAKATSASCEKPAFCSGKMGIERDSAATGRVDGRDRPADSRSAGSRWGILGVIEWPTCASSCADDLFMPWEDSGSLDVSESPSVRPKNALPLVHRRSRHVAGGDVDDVELPGQVDAGKRVTERVVAVAGAVAGELAHLDATLQMPPQGRHGRLGIFGP